MAKNLTQKLIGSHLVSGRMEPGEEIALKIDQTLTQDATGTLALLEFEALEAPRVRTELSVQYVDHNLLQDDNRNADDHLFLRSACQRFGLWFSRPGNGVSHPLHMERFGIPGKTLLGSDSHTPASGALGMLAIGAGGLDVALAMSGEPFHLQMPKIWGVRLTGTLPDWVSAKDVILEMLRRHGVKGGVGTIVEYFGPGLECLSAMDRHVIANMGAELGATTTVFPSDDAVRRFMQTQGRGPLWQELLTDPGASYDLNDEIDLCRLEPLIACPTSPENVVPVREVAGREIQQAYIGSSANPGLRDFAIAALMTNGRQADNRVSFDINPTSRQILENLTKLGLLGKLIHAGARIHQAGCNGCIGMGQAPATGHISLRTVPRNFPGRSGTHEDQVYLCSPETAAASALGGVITDPRTLTFPYPRFVEPEEIILNTEMMLPPPADGGAVQLEKGPNIKPLPEFDPLPDELEGPVLLKVGENISTDEIMPAGARVLPFRSNIPAISRFVFSEIDEHYIERAESNGKRPSFVVAGANYGQGSSREHAAIAPRYLGLRAVLAVSFARIHWHNLVNFGILPLTFSEPADLGKIEQGDLLFFPEIRQRIKSRHSIEVINRRTNESLRVAYRLSDRQIEVILAGGLINFIRRAKAPSGAREASSRETGRAPATATALPRDSVIPEANFGKYTMTTESTYDLQECITACRQCHDVCVQTLSYCLEQGGRHALPAHIRLLFDCIDISDTSVAFMLRDSDLHHATCSACAEVCDWCATDCEKMAADDRMRTCAEVCRACATICRQMASTHAFAAAGTEPTHDEIAALAGKLYENEGRPAGKDQDYWLRAERILRKRHEEQGNGRKIELAEG